MKWQHLLLTLRQLLMILLMCLCCTSQYATTRHFGSYQVTIFYETQTTSKSYLSTGYTYPYVLGDTYQNINNIGLTLCGYKFISSTYFTFESNVTSPQNNNTVNIYFNPLNDLQVYYATFYIVITTHDNPNFMFITGRIQFIEYIIDYQFVNCSTYSRSSFTIEAAEVTTPYYLTNGGDMRVGFSSIYMVAVNSATLFSFDIMSGIYIVNSTKLSIKMRCWNNQFVIYNISYSVIAINMNMSFVRQASGVNLQSHKPTAYQYLNMSYNLPNFNISLIYTPNYTNKCVFLMRQVNFRATYLTRQIFFNATTPQITNIIENYQPAFNTYWTLFCSLTCASNAFYSTNTCAYCSIPNCLTCTNNSYCTQCALNMYYRVPSHACQCNLQNWTVSGGCTDIQGCLAIATDNSTGTVTCSTCSSGFHISSGICVCNVGTLINGVCGTAILGCLTIAFTNGNQICTFCNIAKNFTLDQTGNSFCACKIGMYLTNDSCMEICGDGIFLGFYQCDDGNLINGDGCSDSCTIQNSFKCFTTNQTTPSNCLNYPKYLNLSLQQIYRSKQENQGIFQFVITSSTQTQNDFLSLLDFTDFKTILSFSCNSTAYKILNGKYTNKIFTFTVAFIENLQNLNGEFLVQFNKNKIIYKNLTVNFQVISLNVPLIVTTKQKQYTLIKISLDYFCIVPWLIFIISSFLHKMIGVEILNVFQIIFFLQSQSSSYPLLLSSLQSLKLSMDYNKFFFDQKFSNTNGNIFSRMELNSNYFSNFCIVGGIYVVIILGYIFLKIVNFIKTANKLQQNVQKLDSQNEKLKSFVIWYYYVLFFPFTVAVIIQSTIAVYVQNISKVNVENVSNIPLKANSIMTLLVLYSSAYVFFSQVLKHKSKDIKVGLINCHRSYITLYVIYLYGLVILGLFGSYLSSLLNKITSFSSNLSAMLIGAWILAYTCLILVKRPYTLPIHNFSIILNQFTLLFFITWLNVQYFLNITDESIQLFVIIILIGLLLLICVVGVVRIYVEYRNQFRITPFSSQKLAEAVMEESKQSIFQKDLQNRVLKHKHQALLLSQNEGVLINRKISFEQTDRKINFQEKLLKARPIPQDLRKIHNKLKQSLLKYKMNEGLRINMN